MFVRARCWGYGGVIVLFVFELLTTVEQAEQMLLIQVLLVIYGYDLSGHRCCSNTDGCSNKWMAVLQSRELSALWDSALVTRDPWQRGCPSVTIGQSSNSVMGWTLTNISRLLHILKFPPVSTSSPIVLISTTLVVAVIGLRKGA